MHLKNLTVLGFKSFADKTSLNFQPGITAVVGPNGCGKSNIADAIRWVLGEQSAKALRGGEMADVIFSGTDSRKPIGMAEVSLTITEVDEDQLKAAGVQLDFNEVTITRRVFRDGGSEYLLNKTPCRLKDIQQLFMGTGVGRSSYSIMAQGNITQILSSKPEDRRIVFEEAAGITKFKAQKRESLRKLEHTEQNLLRVADLIREVKRQIGSLQRQAGKARRYKQFMLELQHLETQLARHQLDLLQDEISHRNSSLESLQSNTQSSSENVCLAENQIAQLRSLLAGLEEQVQATQQNAHDLKIQIDRHDGRIHFNQERLAELDDQNTQALHDITQAEERRLISEQELELIDNRLRQSSSSLDQYRSTLDAKNENLLAVEKDLESRQNSLRQTQSDSFAAAQQLARLRNDLNSLNLQKQTHIARLEKLAAERVQLEEEKLRLEQRLEEFAAQVEQEQVNVQTRRGTVEERQQRLRDLEQELARATRELDALLHQQSDKRSRLNVLDQLQSEYEGFSAGALAALKKTEQVIGSLADKIRVPNEYITAVETALGHHLQLVLTEQPETAEHILSELAANKKGRASIAPVAFLDQLPLDPAAAAQNGSTPRLSLHSLGVIEADPSVQALLHSLLGKTYIVPDLPTATARFRESVAHYNFVTLSGELLDRHGIYTGGSGNGPAKPAASVLGRKNEIAELQTILEGLQDQSNEAGRRKEAIQSEQTALQAGLQQAQNELRSHEVAIATRQGEFNALQNSLRGLGQKIETVIYEIDSLSTQSEEGDSKLQTLSGQISQLEQRETALQEELAAANSNLEELRHQRESANALLTETKVALAAEEQLCASLKHQQASLRGRLQELTHLLQRRRQETESFLTRRAQLDAEIEESKRQIADLHLEREQVNVELAGLFAQKAAQDAQIIEHEKTLRELRLRLSQFQQQRGAIEVELAQKNMAADNLHRRIWEKYQVKLEDIPGEAFTITYTDEATPKVETVTPEELAASGAPVTDWEEVAKQVAALQKRIDEMGPVNLVAIEEYEEVEQRHTFLSSQHDDLVNAKTQLLEVINRINIQTREMFTDTFNKIRDNFRSTFTEIFGGGKADLVLVNEGDVLESGIDIVARPPGKQLQSISLLSGGEQTMTAVALLFSIYQVKPSPFCVLDELDAPLDESNINRFIRILQRFLTHSQFIIITHNKRTIGIADVLYGVTMEEQGVSKIVSVKFHNTGHDGAGGLPLVPPAAASPAEPEPNPEPRSGQNVENFQMAEALSD